MFADWRRHRAKSVVIGFVWLDATIILSLRFSLFIWLAEWSCRCCCWCCWCQLWSSIQHLWYYIDYLMQFRFLSISEDVDVRQIGQVSESPIQIEDGRRCPGVLSTVFRLRFLECKHPITEGIRVRWTRHTTGETLNRWDTQQNHLVEIVSSVLIRKKRNK